MREHRFLVVFGERIVEPGFNDRLGGFGRVAGGLGPHTGYAPFNLPGLSEDPVLSVHPPDGPAIASNDDGEDDGPAAAAEIGAASEAAQGRCKQRLYRTGPVTFVVSGKNGATGIVLLELYRVP